MSCETVKGGDGRWDECPSCHAQLMPKWNPLSRAENGRMCPGCKHVEEKPNREP
jgi:hypothetical protein